jgi:hypothetical protein
MCIYAPLSVVIEKVSNDYGGRPDMSTSPRFEGYRIFLIEDWRFAVVVLLLLLVTDTC